jgi:hypothetical protein
MEYPVLFTQHATQIDTFMADVVLRTLSFALKESDSFYFI